MINVSGHRIGTAEVEGALTQHARCAEAAVVPVEHPIKGQGIYAYVTLMVVRARPAPPPSARLSVALPQLSLAAWLPLPGREHLGPCSPHGGEGENLVLLPALWLSHSGHVQKCKAMGCALFGSMQVFLGQLARSA